MALGLNGKFPRKVTGSRNDGLPLSDTASLSDTQAPTGKLSISGDARFPAGLPKSRRKG